MLEDTVPCGNLPISNITVPKEEDPKEISEVFDRQDVDETRFQDNFQKEDEDPKESRLNNLQIEEIELNQNQDIVEKTTIGDLYVLGKLWIDILEAGLLGHKWKVPSIIPKVEAAPPPVPQRPPKMKYKDLPVYTTPHLDYKDYEADKIRTTCPDLKKRLIHESVYPYVKSYRKNLMSTYKDFCDESCAMKKEAMTAFRKKKNEFISYMRCGKNKTQRQGVVALGAATGFFLSRKYKTVTPRIFYTGVGVLATGALCFPEETDEVFRTLSHATGQVLVSMYNFYCNKGYSMRGRLPCATDLPGPLPRRVANKCPVKKN